nr:hypothetical protein CFP56_53399 [Quercus suber]
MSRRCPKRLSRLGSSSPPKCCHGLLGFLRACHDLGIPTTRHAASPCCHCPSSSVHAKALAACPQGPCCHAQEHVSVPTQGEEVFSDTQGQPLLSLATGRHAHDEPLSIQPYVLHGVRWALNASPGWTQVGISRVHGIVAACSCKANGVSFTHCHAEQA